MLISLSSLLHKYILNIFAFVFCSLTYPEMALIPFTGINCIFYSGINSIVYICYSLFRQSPIFEHLSTFQYFAIIQKGSNENLVHIVGSVLSMQSPRDGIAGPKT